MFTLSKTRLMKRLMVGFASVLLLAGGVFFALKQNKIEDTNAATGDGANVTVNFDGDLNDPSWPRWGGYFASPKFRISNGSSTMPGFCINAQYGVVAHGEVIPAWRTNNNPMKLMLYIYTVENSVTNAALSEIGISRNNEGFARTHTIVAYINDPDGVTSRTDISDLSSRITWLNGAVAKLNNYISTNAEVWQQASVYQLYTLDHARTVGICAQNVAWIEPMYGDIKIQKLDNDTNTATPQGGASLAGIHFEVVRISDNTVVAEGLTGNDGTVTFSRLLAGVEYKVRETVAGSTNTSYTIEDKETTAITLSTSGYTFSVKDSVKRGDATINKVDKETQSCENKTSELSFAGTKFQIKNNSTNPVVINGTTYAKNAVIETKTFGANTCSVKFENLPFGDYIINEIAAGEGYVLNGADINVTIPTNNSYSVSKKVENQPIRGDVKFVKMDKNNNIPMDNTLFSISALDKDNNVKETHLVVSNQNGIVDTSASFIRHSNHTNGYDALYDAENPIVYLGYGTWFGLDSSDHALAVNDNLGALPYGTYIIQELKCDANFFCSNIMNQKKTIQIKTANQVVDLGDWDNACAKFELQTTASDGKDGDSVIEEGENVTIKDEVEYCVKAGMDFKIKGILMDKSTGEPLLIDGKPIESEVDLNSETDCGTINMYFTFDATGLGGKDLVVFEKLYYGEDLLTTHEDIDDEGQTVHVFRLTTHARNKETLDKVLPLDKDVVIEDLVRYCVLPGYKYKIHGVLMDKSTGNGVLVNSESVEQSVIIEPEEPCGEVVMEYPINTAGLGGRELVIFETLYLVEDGGSEEGDETIETEIISHKDLSNEEETVRVELPTPDTGYVTKSNDAGTTSYDSVTFIGGATILGLGGYIIFRRSARRKVMKF